MSRYTYRVGFFTFHHNFAGDFYGLNTETSMESSSAKGVFINGSGAIASCAGTVPIMTAPLDQWRALESCDDYAVSAAGSMFRELTKAPAVPYDRELNAERLTDAMQKFRETSLLYEKHGVPYDTTKSLFQYIKGNIDQVDSTIYALANRVEGSVFTIYRGKWERMDCVWEGTEEEFWTRYNAAVQKVKADNDYVDRYEAKWKELRQENIINKLPELARKDGVLLMNSDQFASWQQKARYAVKPTDEQVRAALDAQDAKDAQDTKDAQEKPNKASGRKKAS